MLIGWGIHVVVTRDACAIAQERPPIDPPAVAKGLLDLPTAHPLLPPGKTRSPPPDAPPAGSVPPRDMYGRPVDSSKFVDAGPDAWMKQLSHVLS